MQKIISESESSELVVPAARQARRSSRPLLETRPKHRASLLSRLHDKLIVFWLVTGVVAPCAMFVGYISLGTISVLMTCILCYLLSTAVLLGVGLVILLPLLSFSMLLAVVAVTASAVWRQSKRAALAVCRRITSVL